MPVLLFCQCGSARVTIHVWQGQRARLRCLACNREAWLDGFTISDFDPGALIVSALIDQARKLRQRSPDELRRAQDQRREPR